MLKLINVLILVFISMSISCKRTEKDPIDYVDPFLGTSSCRWMLFPGPAMPFGMVKLSPDNTDEYLMDAGYEYEINSISGFGHVHSWMVGSFLMMPATGELKIVPGTRDEPDFGYRSRISHEKEKASPGYYSVQLEDYDIQAELTATTRGGFQRYSFPKNTQGRVLFDMVVPEEGKPIMKNARIRKVSDNEIEGYVSREAGWNEYILHFVARFNQPFTSMGGWAGSDIQEGVVQLSTDQDQDFGAFLNFDLKESSELLVQTGISFVSMEQARSNMQSEMEGFAWDFDKAVGYAQSEWNSLLGKIQVEGGSEDDKTKFYTNLYRSYSARTIFSDANGKYMDMCENVQQLKDPESPVYGCDAFWNTFWNLNQLWGLVNPDITEKWVNSLLEIYDKGGWLPKGPGGLEYSSIMVASHEISLIVNAWQKGIQNFDAEKAYKAMKEIQMNPAQPHPCGGYVGNRNIESYKSMGYVPANEGPVSNTLEYAYDDWCVAQMAKALGKEEDYRYFLQRAQNYRNVFDAETGYMRPKHAGGPWYEEFVPVKSAVGKEDNFGTKEYVEANAWQFSWFVPHDLKGLIEIMGKDEFNDRLDQGFNDSRPVFTSEFVNHSNQPNMQAPWLFNYSGKPWLTQYWTREVLDHYYGLGPVDGYPGDEDQGQMGAWYVMSAMGLFQMDGGASVNPVYELSGPLFERISIQLDQEYYEGKEIVIEAKNVCKENRYIQSATWNGEPFNEFWISHEKLVKGGTLVLEMGDHANKSWGVTTSHPIEYDLSPIVTTPYVHDTDKLFMNERKVTLACDTEGAEIRYTLDGSMPGRKSEVYKEPFLVDKTTVVKMLAFVGDRSSMVSEATIKKASLKKAIQFKDVKPGINYKYIHGTFRMVNDFLDMAAVEEGITSNFSIENRKREQFFAYIFDGYIRIPEDGLYTFYLATNDGGILYVDDEVVVNNDGLHPFAETYSQVALKAGLHPISVKYFQEGGSNGLRVSWQGPRFEKKEISSKVLYH